MENTFLGSTSAQDIVEESDSIANGTINKEHLARAWILYVAAEHPDLQCANLDIAALGVSFKTTDDADKAYVAQNLATYRS
jgi:hypothetical protein